MCGRNFCYTVYIILVMNSSCFIYINSETITSTPKTIKPSLIQRPKGLLHPKLNKKSITSPTITTLTKSFHVAADIAPQPIASPNDIQIDTKPLNYDFQYAVHDPHTGDIKEHKETRTNDLVEGYYSLIEPDGRRRIVKYSANNLHGFSAIVTHEGVPEYQYPSTTGRVPQAPAPAAILPPNIVDVTPVFLKSSGSGNLQQEFFKSKHFAPLNKDFLQGVVSHVAFQAPSHSYKY